MDTITLLIKGTMADAVRELAARSLVTVSIVTQNSNAIVRVPFTAHAHDKVAQWFISPPSNPPYPPGALLHYTLPEPSVAHEITAIAKARGKV